MSNKSEKDFLGVDDQIDMNQNRLDFYYTNYQKTQTRFAIIMLLYSTFSVYIVQLFFFLKKCLSNDIQSYIATFYFLALVTFVIFLIKSIFYSVKFLTPVEIAYMELPDFFYKEVKDQYIQNGINQDKLNPFIKATYLDQQEISLKENRDTFESKSDFFYKAFTSGLIALVPFIFTLSIYIPNKEDKVDKIKIENITELNKNNHE